MAKKPSKKLIFNSYRFQIVPTSKSIQVSFSPLNINSVEDLVKQKNNILKRYLDKGNLLASCKQEFTCRVNSKNDDIYIFRVGFKKQLERTKKDFKKEKLEDWPNVLVVLNNNPNVQKVLIQHNPRLAQDSSTILNKIKQSLNDYLRPFQLYVSIEPLFEEREFWSLVKENWNKITVCDFELFSPNLANISGKITDEMKQLLKKSNSVKSHLKLESEAHSSLDLSEENPQLVGLVNYSSEGGGNIRLKIRGYTRYKNTAKNVKQITIDEMEISAENLEIVKKILPDLFS